MGASSSTCKKRGAAQRDVARTDDADAARAPKTSGAPRKAKSKADASLNAATPTPAPAPCPYVVDLVKLYSHDARLERVVCAAALVRQSIGEFVEDTNFWLARASAADATKKYSPDIESAVCGAITARETQLYKYLASSASDEDDDAGDMTRATRAKDARTFISGAEDITRQSERDFIEDFAERAIKLHEKAQNTYERQLESCVYEHQKARFKLMEAEARFARLQARADRQKSSSSNATELQKDISATDVDINAQLAQCQRFESMLKTRCDEFLGYFAPELERLVYAYAAGKISLNERANDVVAQSITGVNNVQTLFAQFHAMTEADASAIDAPPSPPKLTTTPSSGGAASTENRTPTNTPVSSSAKASVSSDEESLEEGEISEIKKTPLPPPSASKTAVAA